MKKCSLILRKKRLAVSDEEYYLLQQRSDDAKLYPSMLCMFGGALEVDEDVVAAAVREAEEELNIVLDPQRCWLMGHYQDGDRTIYFVDCGEIELNKVTLCEGAGLGFYSPTQAMQENLVPAAKAFFSGNYVCA